jgi:DNA-binding SARP family transcriptional activator
VEFRVLGPVQVLDGPRVVPVPGGRVRTLLAALLLQANHVVPLERIADLLWHQRSPVDPRAAIQTTMRRLRLALGDGGRLIRTRSHGYLIELDQDRLDLERFRRHVDQAMRADGQADRAALLRQGLALWQDIPLSNVHSEELERVAVPQLIEERLDAVEQWIDARLALGEHAQVIPQLAGLTAEHPLREQFWAQTMVALYRAGRSADALEAYRRAATFLADDLGLDPGPRLQVLRQQVLVGDAALSPPFTPTTIVPRSDLPRDVSDFTGREAEIRLLLEAPTLATRTAMVVFAIDGMAGVGKTALAVHAARRLADRYPDGQLFLDLRALEARPLTPEVALGTLLRAVDVPSEQIPADVRERAALWRARTAGRRTLVVFDNALDSAQISSLLPGSPECLVLITSRHRLPGLDGARLLTLDVLPPDDAAELFSRVIGDGRPAAEPDAVAEVLELCGHLPLAIGIAGARLRHRPMWTIGHLADRLRDRRRLTELRTEHRDVSAVFELSYRQLSSAQQRMFYLLSLHPGADLDAYSAAALADVPLADAEAALEVLVDNHLLTQPALGRYRLHDLLRAYAAEHGSTDDQQSARTRLFDFYLHTAAKAMDAAFPHERHRRPHIPVPGTPIPPVSDPERALAWLDTELTGLLSVATKALECGDPLYTVHLSGTLYRYLHIRSYLDEAMTLHSNAIRAAHMIGHRAGQGTALHNLATVHLLRAHYDEAFDLYDRALAIFLDIDDRLGQANALGNMGLLCQRLARHDEAVSYYRRALTIFVDLGDRLGQANALGNLGLLYQRLERHDDALDHFRRQLRTVQLDGGDRSGEANALNNIGLAYELRGDIAMAYKYFRQANGIFQALADRTGEAYATGNLARVYTRWARHAEALDNQQRVLAIARQVGQPDLEASARNGLADILRTTAQPGAALAQYRSARRLAEVIGDQFELMRALDGIAAMTGRDVLLNRDTLGVKAP